MAHYFDDDPAAPSRLAAVDLLLRDLGRTLHLTTDRGVFAADRIDRGTRILLDSGPALPAAGDLLDLGCGYGPIALALAARRPGATVWAVDVNERARRLCDANAAANDLPNVRVAAPDDVPAAVRVAAIWSNPPIRIGATALDALLDRWLDCLTEGGEAVLVVQRHLGADSLAARLQTAGRRVERLRSKQGFRILRVLP